MLPENDRTQNEQERFPLFIENGVLHHENNVVLQNTGFDQPVFNEGLQNDEELPTNLTVESFILENANPTLTFENQAGQNIDNAVLHSMDESGAEDSKKPAIKSNRKKRLKKKKSQKRNVVAAKFFVTPEELTVLKNEGFKNGWSFSNYVRMNLGLPFNQKGRAGSEPIAKLDLDLFFED